LNNEKLFEATAVMDRKKIQINYTDFKYDHTKAMIEIRKNTADQMKVQKQFVQSVKMQSMGAFASKIAHDLNNILGVILASSSMIEMNKVGPQKCSEGLKAINNAVRRGTDLIHQILTFSGKMDLALKPISVSEFFDGIITDLKHVFPETIKFQKLVENNIPRICADQPKFEQMLWSLCNNARDAMPEGGTLTFQADSIMRQDLLSRFSRVDHDQYICIRISDTGTGIDESIKDMIFDPFFSTKGKGKESGLGLSLVYGIVEAHSGIIDLESEPGRGTTFCLYFPVLKAAQHVPGSVRDSISQKEERLETILVVEDEKCLLDLACLMLELKGYRVYAAKDGIEAVDLYKQHHNEIAMVFTDIGLPGLNGREVFAKLKEINPHVKVIFTSGIFIDIKDALMKDGAKDFIQKPYKRDDVLRKIQEVLNAP
jgi:two-component system, cell cycle sensor histidine kinase and response regulator CckA